MARNVFFSFHFDNDFWRTQQVRNIGSIEGNKIATANRWEEVKKEGDTAIKRWIKKNLKGKSCLIVLTGSKTADRKWIDYEIKHAWSQGKGVMGIRIHKLKDNDGFQSTQGKNPFSKFYLCEGEIPFTKVAKLHSSPGFDSKSTYNHIKNNIGDWIEQAIKRQENFSCS